MISLITDYFVYDNFSWFLRPAQWSSYVFSIIPFFYHRLFVIQGKPELELPKLFKAWKITKLTFEFDHEPEGRQRDAKVHELATKAGIEVETKVCHSLYDLDK